MRSRSGSMPSTQRSVKLSTASARSVTDSRKAKPITGLNTLSSKWPCERLELVRRCRKWQAREVGDALGDRFGKAFLRIQSGSDGGAALRQEIQPGERIAEARAAERDLRGITGKFLAERDRRCVLQM